jgi:HlyD family secretion protein
MVSRAAGGLLARVALLLCASLVAAAACGPPAPTGSSVAVRRGTLSRTVAAAGALAGVTSSGPGSVAVVPFVEADAAMIQPRQRVRATLDAIPGLELDGTVLAIAPNAVNISGVTNYYVTIVLSGGDPRLRAGQTVRATVTTAERHDVLVVPSSAVIKEGARRFVNTPGPDGKPVRVPFVPGVEGDQLTQVVSGLREGQPVLLTR